MSDSALRERNRGAYSSPFSGVGVEFFPLGVPPDHSGLVLYETGYLPKNDWWNFPNVLSPFWRLYYNARRGHRVVFHDREIELTPEHLMLIPDRQLFHCRGCKAVPTFWLTFNVARRLMREQQIPILLPPTRTERALIHDITRLFSGKEPEPNSERIFHGSMALLHVVLNRSEIQWQGNTPPVVLQTVRYIEEHYSLPLTVPRLARMANLCTEALARCFKKYQADTIGRFIVKVRVREAAHLLTHTDAPIDDVAEKTGFPNRAYLSRVFKRTTGESPAQFRRRHTGDRSARVIPPCGTTSAPFPALPRRRQGA
jgi:AraC family transcriptional regulator, arabinose operon regulatory protein